MPEFEFDTVLREIAELVARVVEPRDDGPGDAYRRFGPVWALRASSPTGPSPYVYGPMFCVVAQGGKAVILGDEEHEYDPGRFLLNSVAVPAAGRIAKATPQEPCLWIMIELDLALVGSVALETDLSYPTPDAPLRAMESCPIDAPTLDAVVRLVRLFDSPAEWAFLSPLLLREIVYRLLVGGQGPRLHQIAVQGPRTSRVLGAIERLRRDYDKPLVVGELARECGLSPSALHHHFKEVTAMSPIQFQKRMRLQEARRLMVAEGLGAASAAYRVGYDDPAYFNREYRRFFGDPPRRHAARIRDGAASNGPATARP